jgi:glycosylphosphatidylinositol transamidase (GPIT) subunit GPI8
VEPIGAEGALLVLVIHKACGSPALDESPVGEVCAIPVDRFPFSCFTCLEEIVDESEVRLSEELGI